MPLQPERSFDAACRSTLTSSIINHREPLAWRIARLVCFAAAAVLGFGMLYCLLWVVSSSGMAFTECDGHYELFSPDERCRQPPLAGLLALACLVFAVVLGWFGSRIGKNRSHNDAYPSVERTANCDVRSCASAGTKAPLSATQVKVEGPLMPRKSKSRPYEPNAVPAAERYTNVLISVVLIAYGVLGLLTNRMDLNGRRIRIAILEGGPAWLMAAAFLVGAAVLLSAVVDHYDARDNERYYKGFKWAATRLGWCLVVSALVAHLYLGLMR